MTSDRAKLTLHGQTDSQTDSQNCGAPWAVRWRLRAMEVWTVATKVSLDVRRRLHPELNMLSILRILWNG